MGEPDATNVNPLDQPGTHDVSASGHCCPVDSSDFRTALLNNRLFLITYAVAIIILAFGIVLLILMLAGLAFFYPEKANSALLLLGGPLVGLLIVHGQVVKKPSPRE